ncbi:MAG: hypothetical protein PHC90_10710 [Syntrophorhabdaceae bacterium]|nr:hypothetical protein [Syntrophorhabdaceae bacterium]
MLALFLVIPVLSNAGSVSSRYDVTFGGFVKYDVGWTSQNADADAVWASRGSSATRGILADEYGNTFMTGAETRFNFLVKGPDLWGAKTSAFIEGDFRGTSTGNQYGGFQLRHAFMTFKWNSAQLLIGQAWQQWGMPYYVPTVSILDYAQYLKGIRTPQMAFRYFFTKEFNAMFGITSATEWSGAAGGIRQANDGFARSSWPGLQGEVAYWTDRCGKIGPHNLKLALGGYWGRDKETYTLAATDSTYSSTTLESWAVAFRYSLPIVPETKGNKSMSVLLNGNFFVGQNLNGSGWLYNQNHVAYQRPDNTYAAPTLFGLQANLSWWITNALQLNGNYGYLKHNASNYARNTNPNTENMDQSYGVNMLWDANKAVRFGIQWVRNYTGYNDYAAGTGTGVGNAERTGIADVYRFGAWYFF